ncbi:hypothetical protein JCM10207_002831 [Rhodosporidiobolus poonsookiae]
MPLLTLFLDVVGLITGGRFRTWFLQENLPEYALWIIRAELVTFIMIPFSRKFRPSVRRALTLYENAHAIWVPYLFLRDKDSPLPFADVCQTLLGIFSALGKRVPARLNIAAAGLAKVAVGVEQLLPAFALLVVSLFELVYITSFCFLLALVWTAIYYETLRTLWCRIRPPSIPTSGSDFQALFHIQQQAFARFAAAHEVATSVLTDHEIAVMDSQWSTHITSWIKLQDMDSFHMAQYIELCRGNNRDGAWEQLPSELLKALNFRLADLCEELFLSGGHAGQLFTPSLHYLAYELAGTLVTLLSLPGLQHLARPFRRQALFPFLFTYPGWYLYVTRLYGTVIPSPRPKPTAEAAPTLAEFEDALFEHVRDAQDPPRLTVQRLVAFLRLRARSHAAVEAEHRLHGAILDAVLDRKAQKLDLDRARRRIKQD